MNAVIFCSNTGQSEAIAKYFADKLCYPLSEIEKASGDCYDNLVLVFPVHSQNIPYIVKDFLRTAKIKNLTAIATYGRMCCGNVLYEIQHKYHMNVVAGTYIPAKHAYRDGESFRDFEKLDPISEKVGKPSTTEIPKLYKNAFADLFPRVRSRLCVKIYRNSDCNGCGICDGKCPFKAIKSGVINGKCIRCLKCVTACPNNALKFKLRLLLRLYLRKNRMDKSIVYI